MRINRRLTLGALLLVVAAACNAGGGSSQAPSPRAPIKIGSVAFDEARVIAELYAQVLEANGYTVDRTGIGLGQRPVVAPAIESGQIDLQPEYIGSRISYELTKAQPTGAASSPSASSASSAPASSGGITGPTG